MNKDLQHPGQLDTHLSRRTFLNTATVASLTLALPRFSAATTATLNKPVQIGLIADLPDELVVLRWTLRAKTTGRSRPAMRT